MGDQPTVERVKWFTLARKFPQLIGRTPDGAHIPGGPYTITQAVGGLIVLVVGYYSMGLWANFGVLGNYTLLLALTGAVIFGLGRIPLGARNPAAIGMGAFRAVAAPQRGRLRGRPVRIRRPRQLRHRVVICTALPPPPVAETAAASVLIPVDAPAEDPVTAPERTSVPTFTKAVAPSSTSSASDTTEGPVGPVPAGPVPDVEPAPAPDAPVAVPAYAVSVPSVVRAPRPPRSTRRSTTPQLTGVQALLASVGSTPKEN